MFTLKFSKKTLVFLKFSLIFFGLFSIAAIVHEYGTQQLLTELSLSGKHLTILAFTFIPTLFCYSLSWLLASDHRNIFIKRTITYKIYIFLKYTIISIAWNNLTPFLKMGGEPLKYWMLLKHMSSKQAMSSTMNYNIIHLIATLLSFLIAGVLVLFYFQFSYFLTAVLVCVYLLILVFIVYMFFYIFKIYFFQMRKVRFRLGRYFSVHVRMAYRRLKAFYRKHPYDFYLSLSLDICARFLEGFTFFYAFRLLHNSITIFQSFLLDVGRNFFDTLFFFIPFQVGSREKGIEFFMNRVLLIDTRGFLSAAFLYRFVEIVWIIIGYISWVVIKRSFKDKRL